MKADTKFVIVLFLFVFSSGCLFGQCIVNEIHKGDILIERNSYLPTGQLLKTENFKKGEPKGFDRYSYNSKGHLSLKERIDKSGNVKSTTVYEYDKKGRRIKIVVKKKDVVQEEIMFTYKKAQMIERSSRKRNKKGLYRNRVTKFTWKDGNIVKSRTFKKEGEELDLHKSRTYTYDTNKKPLGVDGDGVKYFSKNNVVSKQELDRFEREDKKDSYLIEYSYNNEGYPTEIVKTYRSGKKEKFRLSYTCK